jgi:hypothetical protein
LLHPEQGRQSGIDHDHHKFLGAFQAGIFPFHLPDQTMTMPIRTENQQTDDPRISGSSDDSRLF